MTARTPIMTLSKWFAKILRPGEITDRASFTRTKHTLAIMDHTCRAVDAYLSGHPKSPCPPTILPMSKDRGQAWPAVGWKKTTGRLMARAVRQAFVRPTGSGLHSKVQK